MKDTLQPCLSLSMFPWKKSGIWKQQYNSIIFSSCGKYFIIPLSPMLFKGIHLKYELLCSGRKSPNSIQTRSFRNAERYNSRLCSSFPHSLFADLVSPCWRSLLRPKVSGNCYSTTHSYMASSPLPAPCISTSLSSIHPIFSLIWSHSFDPSQEHWPPSPSKAPLIPTEGWQQLSCNKATFKSKAYANQFLYEGTMLHLFP